MFRFLYIPFMEGLDLLRQMMPFLAGKLTLVQFSNLALALGAPDARHPADLVAVLKDESLNISATARRLGLCSKTVYRRLKNLGIDVAGLRAETHSLELLPNSRQVAHQPP